MRGKARALYDSCSWKTPESYNQDLLNSTQTRKTMPLKLKNAKNTSPGADGIEYRHLKKFDKEKNLGCPFQSLLADAPTNAMEFIAHHTHPEKGEQ